MMPRTLRQAMLLKASF